VRIYNRALSDTEVNGLLQNDTTPPAAVTGLNAAASGEQASLSWQAGSDPESGISAYKIYRGTTSANKTFLKQVSGSTLSSLDTATLPSTAYFYEVSAINGSGLEGPHSTTASVTTGNNPPSAPAALTAAGGNQQVALDWADNTETDLAGYRVYQAAAVSGPYQLITLSLVSTSAYNIGDLTNGTAYFFKVSAVDTANNESPLSASASATPTAADPSLILYYKLDEGSGSQTIDASNHAAPANLIGSPAWVTGVTGSGLSLNGSDQYVETGFTQNLPQWTISTWVKSPTAPSGGPASGPINFDKTFQINWNHPSPDFRNSAGLLVGANWYSASFGSLQANTWYQLTATYDGETLKAYTNGVLVSSNASPSGPAAVETSSIKLGRHANAGQYFSGSIDNVRIYNRTLSATEVGALNP
jgi:hypothetical protein